MFQKGNLTLLELFFLQFFVLGFNKSKLTYLFQRGVSFFVAFLLTVYVKFFPLANSLSPRQLTEVIIIQIQIRIHLKDLVMLTSASHMNKIISKCKFQNSVRNE